MKLLRMKNVLLCLGSLVIALCVYYGGVVLRARDATPRIVQSYLQSDQIDMTLHDLSQRQLEILLTVEDPAFYQHHGVDFTTPGAGWTTITQGLAKLFYFTQFRQGIRKIKQTLCARFALDPLVPKDIQLTLYLNLQYFGNGVVGLHDASEYYFHTPVHELEEPEYMALIACLISPNELNIKDHPAENAQRVQRIQQVMSGAYTPQGLLDITYEAAEGIIRQ
jgi:membrane peptidoglycan carboxypeptidase